MTEIEVRKTLQSATGPFEIDFSCTLEEGSFTALYGPSGAGKTSILRMLSGLMTPDSGKITVGNLLWYNMSLNRKTQDRNVGYVFQDYALFPNMTVRENLRYALAKGDDPSIVEELITIVDLGQLKDRKPGTLSGGQQQRVALARALVRKPALLLLDEPLSALDRQMRIRLQDYLIRVHREFGLTTLIVTHDTSEVIRLCDRIISIDMGKVVYDGRPDAMFFDSMVSGKVRLTGEIIDIVKADVIDIVSVLCGNDIVRVVVSDALKQGFSKGDHVMIATKAFNPIIRKVKH